MSKNDKIAKLKEYIKNVVIKELENDDELEEVSTTATAGAANASGTGIYYDTPKAFASSASGSQGGHPKPDVVGYTKVKESVIKEYVSVDNFNKDFMTAMNLVIKQANNLKGPLGKHPIKRNVNKLKAVLSIYKKFVAPALVKAVNSIKSRGGTAQYLYYNPSVWVGESYYGGVDSKGQLFGAIKNLIDAGTGTVGINKITVSHFDIPTSMLAAYKAQIEKYLG